MLDSPGRRTNWTSNSKSRNVLEINDLMFKFWIILPGKVVPISEIGIFIWRLPTRADGEVVQEDMMKTRDIDYLA